MTFQADKLIYFIRPVGKLGPVKIGCSVGPKSRLIAMQAWSPVRLQLVASCPGWNAHEQMIHAKFISSRAHGEWFEWSSELGALINHVLQHGSLPPEFDTPPHSPETWRAFHGARAGSMKKGTAKMVEPSQAAA